MGVVIGIDVGGSTTKIVGVENKSIQSPMFVKATDPVTSLFGAFGKYIYDNGITLPEIEMVMLTGVGSAFIDQPLYGLPTAKTDEFLANGLGAKYTASLENLIVVSMGTGTSFVKVEGPHIQHIGGIGIGGGTLLGLSRLLLKTQDIHLIAEMARKGTLTNIDLQIQDICNRPLPTCRWTPPPPTSERRTATPLPKTLLPGLSTWSCNRSARLPSCRLSTARSAISS